MIVEHRNAPRPDPVELVLRVDGAPHLEVTEGLEQMEESVDPIKGRILEVLSTIHEPMTQEALRAKLRVRLQRLVSALRDLEREARVLRQSGGWMLPTNGNNNQSPSPIEP